MTPEERRIFESWQLMQKHKQETDESLLGKGVNYLDLLNTLGYAVGGLISSGGTMIDSPLDSSKWKLYGAQWKISPSEAMGVTKEKTDIFSAEGIAGLALDIALDPTTYLSWGSSAGVKIASVGGSKAMLSKGGVKTLASYINKYKSIEAGTMEFMHHIEMSPAFAKKVQSFEGIGLRGWGIFAQGFEKELISKETISKGLGLPGQAWDKGLQKLAMSGESGLAAALKIKDAEKWSSEMAKGVKWGLQDRFQGAGRRTQEAVTEVLQNRKTMVKAYDKVLQAWKWTSTVPFPAYHVTNLIGAAWNSFLIGIDLKSYKRGLRTVASKGGAKEYKTALGEVLTADELYKEASQRGVIGQSGRFDVDDYMASTGDSLLDRSKTLWNKISPSSVARREEDFVRMSLYIDRRLKGDAPDIAKEWVARTQFSYALKDMTAFEQNVMKRLIPFYVWEKNNLLLQTEMIFKQPGKYAALAKAQGYGAEGETLPDWAWSMMPLGVEDGRFRYIRTPIGTLEVYGTPGYLYDKYAKGQEMKEESSYLFDNLSPLIKLPIEQNVRNEQGQLVNSFTGQPYDDRYGPLTNVLMGRFMRTYTSATNEDKTEEERFESSVFGIGTALTLTEQARGKRYAQSLGGYNTTEKIAIARESGWKSALSDDTTGLGIYDIKQVGKGGEISVVDSVLLTADQILEQERAFRSEAGIQDRTTAQEQQWGKLDKEFLLEKATIEGMRLNKGKRVNEAQREQRQYNLRKRENIKYINIEITKLQRSINQLEKFTRGEIIKGTPRDERNVEATKTVLKKYYATIAELKALRETETGKGFNLPNQAADGEGQIAGIPYKALVRKGEGQRLLDKEAIKGKVSIKELSDELRYAVGDIRIEGMIPDSLIGYGITEDELRQTTRDMWDERLQQDSGLD